MSVTVAPVGNAERPGVEAVDRSELKREVPLDDDQEVFAARDGGAIVAALRLCPEAGTLLLRTVVVAEGRRGQGIGRALLDEASRAIGRRECWCFGWSYLEEFYKAIGLDRVPEAEVPARLRDRIHPNEIAMYRAATT